MTYEVPTSQASVDQDKFKFKIGSQTFSIKKAKFLTVGEAEALESPESATDVLDMFGRKGTKQGDAIRSLDQEQFSALVEAWKADSGLDAGKSPAS